MSMLGSIFGGRSSRWVRRWLFVGCGRTPSASCQLASPDSTLDDVAPEIGCCRCCLLIVDCLQPLV
eukprot:scaffold6342_cov206-Alexandrium_tamarense.AAC.47